MQNKKGPAAAEPEIFFSKNANGVRGLSWSAFGAPEWASVIRKIDGLNPLYIVECFRSGMEVA